MIFLLLSVWASEALAVHALFGAFLAGIVMPKGGQLQEGLRDRLESVTLVLLLPLFFAFTGLRTSIALLNSVELWLLCGLIVMVAVGSKLLVSGVIVHASDAVARVAGGGSPGQHQGTGRARHPQCRTRLAHSLPDAFLHDGDNGPCHHPHDSTADRLDPPAVVLMGLLANSCTWRIRVRMTSLPAPLAKPPPTKEYLLRRRSCGGYELGSVVTTGIIHWHRRSESI